MRHSATYLSGFVIVALLCGSDVPAHGQTVAYRAFGTGFYSPVNGDYGGVGRGTHLGRHDFLGNVQTAPTANPFVFTWSLVGTQETTAANGDKLFFQASGEVELIPLDETFTTFSAVWTGDFVIDSGTGRFANAKPAAEPLRVIAVNDPFTFADPTWTFNWRLSGRIQTR